jgi:hypothetical protein
VITARYFCALLQHLLSRQRMVHQFCQFVWPAASSTKDFRSSS